MKEDTMDRLVEIDGFLVEVEELDPESLPLLAPDSGDKDMGGLDDSVEKLRETIGRVVTYVKGAFNEANRPDELTVKFGIKLAGEKGIPFVTKGSAEASLAVEATWTKAKSV